MQLIASAMAEKIEFITTMNAKPLSLSDRVINYIKYKCDNKTLKGIEKAAFYLESLAEIFCDDFYLEIQPGRFSEQLRYNDFLICLAKKYSLKIVAANDVHYLQKEDSEAHNYHVLDMRTDEHVQMGEGCL